MHFKLSGALVGSVAVFTKVFRNFTNSFRRKKTLQVKGLYMYVTKFATEFSDFTIQFCANGSPARGCTSPRLPLLTQTLTNGVHA